MAVFELNITMIATLRTPTTLSSKSLPADLRVLRRVGHIPPISVCKMLSLHFLPSQTRHLSEVLVEVSRVQMEEFPHQEIEQKYDEGRGFCVRVCA